MELPMDPTQGSRKGVSRLLVGKGISFLKDQQSASSYSGKWYESLANPTCSDETKCRYMH